MRASDLGEARRWRFNYLMNALSDDTFDTRSDARCDLLTDGCDVICSFGTGPTPAEKHSFSTNRLHQWTFRPDRWNLDRNTWSIEPKRS